MDETSRKADITIYALVHSVSSVNEGWWLKSMAEKDDHAGAVYASGSFHKPEEDEYFEVYSSSRPVTV